MLLNMFFKNNDTVQPISLQKYLEASNKSPIFALP